MKKLLFIFVSCLCLLCLGRQVRAETSEEVLRAMHDEIRKLSQTVEELSYKVEAQQERIEELEQSNQALRQQAAQPIASSTPAPASPPITSSLAPPPSGVTWTGSFKQGLSAFNPEIGVVADIVASFSESKEDFEGNDKVSVREIELVFGHDIDPYSRFDSTFTLSDFEDPDIEEAYITHFGLPFDLKGKLGRMRPKIGKASAMHRDVLETVDEPLVVQNYLGIEGLFRTGLELGYFIPAPWEVVTHELTLGIMEGGIGEDGTLFGEARRRPSFYAHLKNFWDVSDVTNFEFGGTYLLGSSDEDSSYEVNAFGVDATLIHFVDPIHRLKLQSEFYFQDRDEPFIGGEEEETAEEELEEGAEELLPEAFDDSPWGMYALVDYRLSQRFSLGGRWDYVIPTDIDPLAPEDADWAASGYLTFHQSEFARWRIQYQHVEFTDGEDDDRLFLQGTVAIGVHKHQLQ